MPGSDPSHWLRRLSAQEWLAAADSELRQCRDALARRAVRTGVTHARRGAGMALNAVLVLEDNERWGRSYMDHITGLAADESTPPEVREAAERLRAIAPSPPTLVTLGKPDMRALEEARRIVAYASARVVTLSST